MAAEAIEIRGANAFETFTKTRVGCRGIVVQGDRMLISHEVRADCCLIPGGGLEDGETLEACCVREIREETGYLVRPVSCFLTLTEFYEEYRYISYYFLCEAAGKTEQSLTDAEKDRGLVPEWIPVEEMLAVFGRHQDYAATDEEKRGAYLREYTALTEYCKLADKAGP